MAEPFSSSTAVLVRRNRWLLGLALAAVLGALATGIFGERFDDALFPLLLAGVFSAYVLVRNPWPNEEKASVRADAEGVRVNGALEAPQDRIRDGFVVPQVPQGFAVRIQRRMAFPLELRVRSEAEGRTVLRALGLDATQRAMTFTLPSRATSELRWMFPVLAAFFTLFYNLSKLEQMLGPRVEVLKFASLAILPLFFLFTRTKLTVGADGVWLRRIGQRRFWSYDDIAEVEPWANDSIWRKQKWEGLLLTLRSGERVQLAVQMRSRMPGYGERVHVIEQRIREAMDSHRRGDTAADAALLGRGKREVGEWIRSLRAMGSGAAADHRTAPVEPERLWRIVEDARATPEARAGAAAALGGVIDAEGRARLRVAAGAVAAPRLRVALEAAAGEDEDALREAFAALEEPQRRARI